MFTSFQERNEISSKSKGLLSKPHNELFTSSSSKKFAYGRTTFVVGQ